MKKHSHFLLLILFNLNIYAFDACSEFLRIAKLESNQSILSTERPVEIPSLQLKVDIDNATIDTPSYFLRSDANRVYPHRIFDEESKKGIKNKDDLAELSVDELQEIIEISSDDASKMIMKAREHWFNE